MFIFIKNKSIIIYTKMLLNIILTSSIGIIYQVSVNHILINNYTIIEIYFLIIFNCCNK